MVVYSTVIQQVINAQYTLAIVEVSNQYQKRKSKSYSSAWKFSTFTMIVFQCSLKETKCPVGGKCYHKL